MSLIMVDIESGGPCPGLYPMIEIGAWHVTPNITNGFSVEIIPDPDNFHPDTMKAMNWTQEILYNRPYSVSPIEAMKRFENFILQAQGQPIFISDNNGFDWQFVNYYFWRYIGRNPFGFSSMNLGQLYKGLRQDIRQSFRHLRKTKHTHKAIDDALGNTEALLQIHKDFPCLFKNQIRDF